MRHLIALLTITGLLTACSDPATEAEQQHANSSPAEPPAKTMERVAEATMDKTADTGMQSMEMATEAAEDDTLVTGEAMADMTSEAEAPMAAAEAESTAAASGAEPQIHVVGTQITAFVPMVLFIQPGDTVKWTNMAAHNSVSLEGMIPEGAESWESQLGADFDITLTVPGAYIYKCTPHVSQGMVAAIVVGDENPANLEQLRNSPENKGMVGRAIRKLVKAIDERG